MKLNEIKDNFGATHYKKVVGRGIGSGKGKTAGKGHKGQKARGTGKVRLGFEGGQNPIYRRMPKRGFTNEFRKDVFIISTMQLNKHIESGKIDSSKLIDYDYLKSIGVIKGTYDSIKVLAKGDILHKLSLKVNAISAKAKEIIESKSGSIELIEEKVFKNKKKVY
jgi:large subunit ribosomal protein L15